MSRIEVPGVYQLSIAAYVSDPAPAPSLSASLAHILLTKSARHCWHSSPRLNPDYVHEDGEQLGAGTIAHALLLEKDDSRVVTIDAPDWRTKAAKAQRDAARADGKLPVLADKMEEIRTMVDVARREIAQSELAEMLTTGQVEQTLLWQEGETWCRSRPDWMSDDGRILADYKSTAASGEPDAWARGLLLSMGFDIQAAFGLRAAHMLLKSGRGRSFVFIVQETSPPYAVSLVGLSPEFEAWAEEKRARAVHEWTRCLATGAWPSYPSRICWAEPPVWAVTRWGERIHSLAPVGAGDDGSVDEL